MEYADAIIVGDLHIRMDQPSCRVDDFVETQTNKFKWLDQLQQKHKCPIICGGDVFHKWHNSNLCVNYAIERLRNRFLSVYGNHDLPQHDIHQKKRCSLYALEAAGLILRPEDFFEEYELNVMAVDYGDKNGMEQAQKQILDILVLHEFNYPKKDGLPHPGCTSDTAERMFRKYKNSRLIITGDNHQPFVIRHKNRLLVNPGSFTRQSATETHCPRVYLWQYDGNGVEEIPYPDFDEKAVTRKHIDVKADADERINTFVKGLKEAVLVNGLDFRMNVETALETMQPHQQTEIEVLKAMEGH